jgi:hypothetical protein
LHTCQKSGAKVGAANKEKRKRIRELKDYREFEQAAKDAKWPASFFYKFNGKEMPKAVVKMFRSWHSASFNFKFCLLKTR